MEEIQMKNTIELRTLGAVHTHTCNLINTKSYVLLLNIVLFCKLQKYRKIDGNIMSVSILDTG